MSILMMIVAGAHIGAVREAAANGAGKKSIGLRQEGRGHIDERIAKMEIAAIWTNRDVADIGRKKTNKGGKDSSQGKEPEPRFTHGLNHDHPPLRNVREGEKARNQCRRYRGYALFVQQ